MLLLVTTENISRIQIQIPPNSVTVSKIKLILSIHPPQNLRIEQVTLSSSSQVAPVTKILSGVEGIVARCLVEGHAFSTAAAILKIKPARSNIQHFSEDHQQGV